MKNIKKLSLLLIMVGSFFILAIGKVEAFQIKRIVCDPTAVEKGENSTCYVVGKFDAGDAFWGLVTNVWTQDLNILETQSGITNSFNVEHRTDLKNFKNWTYNYLKAPTGADYTYASYSAQGLNDEGFMLFSSVGTDQNFKTSSFGDQLKVGSDYKVAKIEVQLAPDAKGCGYICLSGFSIETSTSDTLDKYSHTDIIKEAGSSTAQSTTCGDVQIKPTTPTPTPTPTKPSKKICQYTGGKYYDNNGNVVSKSEYEEKCVGKNICKIKDGKYYDNNGDEVTKDIYEANCTSPDTGNYVSYIVLIVGALIAVIATVIAKKNNKFYRV